VISTLTIGVPGFFLALSPRAPRVRPGILPRVVRFAAPAGLVAAAAAYTAYALARAQTGNNAADARTAATVVITAVGLCVLTQVARPLTAPRTALIGAMAVVSLTLLLLPMTRHFLALAALPWPVWAGAAILTTGAALLLHALPALLERLLPLSDASR
jgi:cation-transporting ATPase E